MQNYKLLISYDGTRYNGWQSQENTKNTIQEKLEAVISSVLSKPVEIAGSGRTDAGVHAQGQVASFKTSSAIFMEKESPDSSVRKSVETPPFLSKEAFLEKVNSLLPKDIAVNAINSVPENFHARLSACSKTYMYRIHTSAVSNVFEHRFMYDYTAPLDVSKMKDAASYLVGTHDFKSFCGNRHMKKSTVRTITSIDISVLPDEIRILYTGNGFLMNMVRILTGTLIETGAGKRTPESIPAVLATLDRSAAGYTAPAEGLTLLKVEY